MNRRRKMITSTEKKYWYQSAETDPTAVSVKVELGAEAQTIRGFGGCFSELGAVALKDVPEEEKTAYNNLCRCCGSGSYCVFILWGNIS